MSLIHTLRTIWTLGRGVVRGLTPLDAERSPYDLFADWFEDARRSGLMLPEAMTVATATATGAPSARLCLLKGHGPDGFVFFTNYESRKAQELTENPQVALAFHWPVLERQVRVEGSVHRLAESESDTYFTTRPRGSRVGAWASKQSDVLPDRQTLERRVQETEQTYAGQDIPRPVFWGGYRVQPRTIEFWQGRADRLHDRLQFTRQGDGWTVERLYP